MSLPSVVIFYKKDKEVKREFINCGWICRPETVKSAIKRSLQSSKEKFDWDLAKAYGMEIKIDEL
jgi:hypothetical protein